MYHLTDVTWDGHDVGRRVHVDYAWGGGLHDQRMMFFLVHKLNFQLLHTYHKGLREVGEGEDISGDIISSL